MDRHADEAADQRTVDADELEVAADCAFDTVGDGAGVPAAHGFRHQPDDLVAVAVGDADRGAAGEAVDLALEAGIVAQRAEASGSCDRTRVDLRCAVPATAALPFVAE